MNSPSIKKKDLVNMVVLKLQKQNTMLKKKDVVRIIEMFLNIMENMLSCKKEEKIQLSGFGTFYIRKRQPRIGRNPKTKETYIIPERYSIGFKPSQNFILQANHKQKK